MRKNVSDPLSKNWKTWGTLISSAFDVIESQDSLVIIFLFRGWGIGILSFSVNHINKVPFSNLEESYITASDFFKPILWAQNIFWPSSDSYYPYLLRFNHFSGPKNCRQYFSLDQKFLLDKHFLLNPKSFLSWYCLEPKFLRKNSL